MDLIYLSRTTIVQTNNIQVVVMSMDDIASCHLLETALNAMLRIRHNISTAALIILHTMQQRDITNFGEIPVD